MGRRVGLHSPEFRNRCSASLGFGAAVWERVAEDWRGPGAARLFRGPHDRTGDVPAIFLSTLPSHLVGRAGSHAALAVLHTAV
jgi:hypothetical protein